MTAQRTDFYTYENITYSLSRMSPPMPFDPCDYGLTPHPSSTACWNGYWCEYDVRYSVLYLKNLYLFNKNGEYPVFNGVSAEPQEFEEITAHAGPHRKPKLIRFPKYHGHRLYKNVELFIPYMGKILAGTDFLRDYYIHMGYQQPFAYKTLMEFVFEDGVLADFIDRSDDARKLREKLDLTDSFWEFQTLDLPRLI